MPVPAFGFSAGDFVSAIGLVRKISKALKRTGGASTEYQHAIIELKSLENVLRHLESMEPNEGNERHINAIRGMALACQLPLRDFLTKVEKFEVSLGPFSSPQWFRGLPQKSKWAVTFGEEVEKMRALVAAKTVSISLLLAMNLSNSISKMETNLGKRWEKEHSELLSKAAEHRSALDVMKSRLNNIEDGNRHAELTSDDKFKALSSDVETTKVAVMSFRGVGQQIMGFISTFPLEKRDLLQRILRSNWQIYHLLLRIQQSPTQSPTQLLDSNIQLEDAMGEVISLPYVYFRHWETFEGFLRSQFKGTIGEVKVNEGHYNILSIDRERTIVKKDQWTRSIDQGASLSMSMIMSRLRRVMGSCPRPSCKGSRFVQTHVRSNFLICELCNLKFYAETGELGDIFGHVTVQDEEEQVAQQQAEEDLRIYDTRHEPLDAVDLDEDRLLSKLPPKRSASEFEAGVDRPAKTRKKSESRTYHYENVTAMDWNAGESPLMAWVNQSALPAAIIQDASKPDSPTRKDDELLQQEKKEIEVFKNVHVSDALAPTDNSKLAASLACASDLDFSAQIYYRNIVDRYPLVPAYLARRLAIVNHHRAERLQQSRLRNESREDFIAEIVDAARLQSHSTTLNTKNVGDNAPSIPITMQETTATTDPEQRKTLTVEECGLLWEHHKTFPKTKQLELAAMFNVERSVVSKVLRSPDKYVNVKRSVVSKILLFPHKYVNKEVYTKPSPIGKSQYRIIKPLQNLDASAPWSSWSNIIAVGPDAIGAPELPASTIRLRQESQSNIVDKEVHSDVYQDDLDKPNIKLGLASQNVFSQHIVRKNNHTSRSPSSPRKASSPKPDQSFWTGRRPSHRPLSVQSYGSSRNSSLHGSPAVDPSYQSSIFSAEDHKSGSAEGGNSPRGLLPAPIDWTSSQSHDRYNKKFSFDCEICGEVVKATRILDWQNHVMYDLRPYMCTAEDCSQPDKTYYQVKDYLRHEILAHEAPCTVTRIDDVAKRAGKSITCLFCGQKTTEGKSQHSRGRHVGQHMEEIAFTVVPKAYEDWEFYSEASSEKQADQHISSYTPEENGCEYPRRLPYPKDLILSGNPADLRHYVCILCDRPFALPEDLSRHHQNFHFSCPKCSQQFPSPFRLNVHQLNCHVLRCDRINPSTGKPCNTEFSESYDLMRHEDTIHNSKSLRVRCKICTERTFSRNEALTRHMRVVHPEVDFPGKKRGRVSPVPKEAIRLEEGVLDHSMKDRGH